MTEKLRKKFENWYFSRDNLERQEDGSYLSYHVQCRWEGYKAGYEQKYMNKITHFYFDMDGVLSDFPGYVTTHCPYEYKEENREKYKEWIKVATNHVDTELFKNLPPSPFIDDMIKLKEDLQRKGIIVATLTSLGGHHHVTRIHSQKKEWLDKHGFSDILYLTVNECHEKKFLAHPQAFLLDDHEKNCDGFIAYGGNAMLYSFNIHEMVLENIRKVI